MQKVTGLIVGIICLGIVNSAYANLFCTGTVKGIRPWGNSQSWVSVSLVEYPGTWIICDINSLSGGVAPSSCKAMYSTALAAFAIKKKIQLQFDDTVYSSCSQIPSWDINLPSKFLPLYISD